MSGRLCCVILDHRGDEYFRDLVGTIRTFCDADIVWYDAGNVGTNQFTDGIPRLTASRPLEYAKEAPFFFDTFEWAQGENYDYLVNLETDLAFVKNGFDAFVASTMATCDYLCPRLQPHTPKTSRWRPYRSLRGEMPELLDILGIDHVNGGFNTAQVFSARFYKALLSAPFYGRLRDFVARNQQPGRSFSLPEVLMPTVAETLGLTVADYPDQAVAYNRYRPYHAVTSVQRAAAEDQVYLVHPVRRDPEHPARRYVRSLIAPAYS